VPETESNWFAGHPGQILLFRVNRRPMWEDSLLPGEMPSDPYEHFVRMLAPGHEVVTGRRSQRIWRVGGLHRDDAGRTLVGKLGWVARDEEMVPEWSEPEKDWVTTASPKGGKVVPFGFDGETRLLAVLRERRSAPSTVAYVFERILRDNEFDGRAPTTEWSVEPVLDAADFLSWLKTLDTVHHVSFTAKLPNPEPRDAFRDLAERMAARRATRYTESLRSDREEGLSGIEEDRDVRQAIAMGEQGFATLRGEGRRGESLSQYSQTNRVAKERVEELPEGWEDVWDLIKHLLKGRLRRFLNDER
jgi:hypothetical protein